MTTEEILERFYNEYIRYHGISGERWRAQRRLLLEFDATLDGRTLAEVTQGDFQSFAGALLDSGLHVNTVRKKLNMIRPLYSWAYAAGVVDAETYLRLKQVKNPRGSSGNSIPQPYTRKDLDRFWSELESAYKLMPAKGPGSQSLKRWLTKGGGWTHVRRHAMRLQLEAMVRLALDCGMRRSEIFGLTLDDMHYENEYIVVRGKADPTTGLPKVRSVPVTGDARAAIKQWVEFRTLLRPTLGHGPRWPDGLHPVQDAAPAHGRTGLALASVSPHGGDGVAEGRGRPGGGECAARARHPSTDTGLRGDPEVRHRQEARQGRSEVQRGGDQPCSVNVTSRASACAPTSCGSTSPESLRWKLPRSYRRTGVRGQPTTWRNACMSTVASWRSRTTTARGRWRSA
jgi:site-specific recombinase XerD